MKKPKTSFSTLVASWVLGVALLSGCASSANRSERSAAINAAAGGWKGDVVDTIDGEIIGAGVGDYLDRRQQELEKIASTEKNSAGLKVTLKNDSLFGSAERSSLEEDAYTQLTRLAAILKKYPADRLQVVGYTDGAASVRRDPGLSERRANSVMAFLLEQGVSDKRITATGKNEPASQVSLLIEDPNVAAAIAEKKKKQG